MTTSTDRENQSSKSPTPTQLKPYQPWTELELKLLGQRFLRPVPIATLWAHIFAFLRSHREEIRAFVLPAIEDDYPFIDLAESVSLAESYNPAKGQDMLMLRSPGFSDCTHHEIREAFINACHALYDARETMLAQLVEPDRRADDPAADLQVIEALVIAETVVHVSGTATEKENIGPGRTRLEQLAASTRARAIRHLECVPAKAHLNRLELASRSARQTEQGRTL